MRFAFMVYVARSGSTVLAHQIAERTSSVLVMPEFQTPEILFRAGDAAVRTMEPSRLTRLLRQDPQLGLLGLDGRRLEAVAMDAKGAGIRGVLEALVAAYHEKERSPARVVVLKKGSLAFFHREIARLFPEALLIHPFRDPRGAVNSLIRTRDPYGARTLMARGDSVVAARYWSRLVDEMDLAIAERRIPAIEIRYEELLAKTESLLERLLGFLGAAQDGTGSVPVAAEERSMHALVESPPLASRADAWKEELRPWQGLAIERIVGDRLWSRGYEPWYLPRSSRLSRTGSTVMAAVGYVGNNLAHALRLARHRIPRVSGRRDPRKED